MTDRLERWIGAQDMTKGRPMQVLARFSVPLLIGNLIQQLYSIFDAVIVSRYSMQHDTALVAIAACGSVLNLAMVPMMAIAMSAGILVAQLYGAKDGERLLRLVGTAISVVVGSAVVLTAVGIALAPDLLAWINTPDAAMGIASEYLRILLIGLAVEGLYCILAGVLRGMGDSFWPLAFLVGTVALNAVLDLWFLIGLKWGIQGAAWASVLSQAVAVLLCAIRLLRMKGIVDFGELELVVDGIFARKLVQLAIPAGITQGALSIGILMIQSLVNRMGSDAVVAVMAVNRVDAFAMLHCFAFGHAVATFAGQNMGAGRPERVRLGTHDALQLSMGTSFVMAVILLIFGRYAVGWFSDSERVWMLGGKAFQILAISYLALSAGQVFGGVIRGSGEMVPTMWVTIGTHFLVRVPVAYGLAGMLRSEAWPNGSPDALFYALLATRAIAAVASYLWCSYGGSKWRIPAAFPPHA